MTMYISFMQIYSERVYDLLNLSLDSGTYFGKTGSSGVVGQHANVIKLNQKTNPNAGLRIRWNKRD
jgi:hypothetical protein